MKKLTSRMLLRGVPRTSSKDKGYGGRVAVVALGMTWPASGHVLGRNGAPVLVLSTYGFLAKVNSHDVGLTRRCFGT